MNPPIPSCPVAPIFNLSVSLEIAPTRDDFPKAPSTAEARRTQRKLTNANSAAIAPLRFGRLPFWLRLRCALLYRRIAFCRASANNSALGVLSERNPADYKSAIQQIE